MQFHAFTGDDHDQYISAVQAYFRTPRASDRAYKHPDVEHAFADTDTRADKEWLQANIPALKENEQTANVMYSRNAPTTLEDDKSESHGIKTFQISRRYLQKIIWSLRGRKWVWQLEVHV